ncbi:acetylornithine aminotransferase [Bacteroidia bacterium]|nr:acetylornithine aminotransferase [Bacteroidia bacterium]
MKMFDVYPLHDVAIVRAEGSWVYDDRGQKYLDMYGGHAVISIGHTHPAWVDAIKGQIDRIGFYSNSVVMPLQAEAARALGRVSGREDYQLFMCNSGAEANENALKLASFHTGRNLVVAFDKSFHGRTSLAVAATDNPAIVAPVNRTDNVIFAPLNDTAQAEMIFRESGQRIAAVIIEPIQGVGGIRMADDDFLRTLRRLCTDYGALLISDEVQCGCGRSGRYFALDHAGIEADIYSMAKGIGNGFPVGAIAISPSIAPRSGMLGTTFGGNPLACAAMLAVCQTIENEALLANATRIGDYLTSRLRELPGVGQVRGRGLMIGIELPFDSAALRKKLLFEEKIFVGASGKTIVRLLPALGITRQHADLFLSSFEKLLGEFA